MGGFLSKDTMTKIDKYVDIPAECNDIDATVNAEINQSINTITDKLRQRYAPSVDVLKNDITGYLRVLRNIGIVYMALFFLMLIIQFIIVLMLRGGAP